MKIKHLILKDNDIVTSAKESAISTLLAYNKTYELLHKQLWRKNRAITSGTEVDYNGRTCKAITMWNIISPSIAPYDRDNYFDLGLNQLFAGQDPNAQYQGNPSDGIYKDDCYIYPKSKEVDWVKSADMMGWYVEELQEWSDDSGTWYDVVYSKIVKKFDDFGNIVVDNVTLEEEFETILIAGQTIQQSKGFFLKTYKNGVILTVESVNKVTTLTGLINLTEQKNIPKYMSIDFNASGMGNPIAVEDITDINYVYPTTDNIAAEGDSSAASAGVRDILKSLEYSKVYFFADGTAIQLIPPYSYSIDGGSADQPIIYKATLNAQIMYLPMVYVDTGDLVINKFDFIDNWDDMFGLYVHEKKRWEKRLVRGIIKIVVFVVSIIIGYMTAGVGFKIMGGMFGAIGAYGTISGNKAFQIIGAVGGLFTAQTGLNQDNLTKNFVANGFTQDAAKVIAEDMLLNMSTKEMFKAYASTAGFSNLLSSAKSMFSIYQTISIEEMQASNYTEEESTTRMTGMVEEEEKQFNDYVNKIMRIGDLK